MFLQPSMFFLSSYNHSCLPLALAAEEVYFDDDDDDDDDDNGGARYVQNELSSYSFSFLKKANRIK